MQVSNGQQARAVIGDEDAPDPKRSRRNEVYYDMLQLSKTQVNNMLKNKQHDLLLVRYSLYTMQSGPT